jgi:hypothetical protein
MKPDNGLKTSGTCVKANRPWDGLLQPANWTIRGL